MTIKELRQVIREELRTVMREELREILTEAVQIASSEPVESTVPVNPLKDRMPDRSEISEMIRNSVSFEGGISSLLEETARGMTREDLMGMEGESRVPVSDLESRFMDRASKVYQASLKVKGNKE